MRLLYLKGSSPKEALDKMKAVYGEDAGSYDVKNWHRQFKCGRTSVETVPIPIPIPGHPLSAIDDAIIQQIETAILEDRRLTERQLCLLPVNSTLPVSSSTMVNRNFSL